MMISAADFDDVFGWKPWRNLEPSEDPEPPRDEVQPPSSATEQPASVSAQAEPLSRLREPVIEAEPGSEPPLVEMLPPAERVEIRRIRRFVDVRDRAFASAAREPLQTV